MNTLMKFAFLLRLTATFLLLSYGLTTAQTDHLAAVQTWPVHPRVLLLKGGETTVSKRIGADKTWTQMHQNILTEADAMLRQAPVEQVKIGKRLLDKSREALRRIFFLSYAWRMTRADKYRRRAEQELLAVSAFSDWNPAHFLDVAEMTMAVAIGYDWLYDELSASSRQTIREAIVNKGLNPSLVPGFSGWLKNTNNWNQVCNAGMAYGAMAIYEDDPALAKQIINRAIDTVVLPMGEYKPDGGYPEGYGYWGYGTSFNVMLVSALETLFKTDFGLAQQPGFLNTAGFMENMTGPSGEAFNFSDSGLRGELQPAMFWFAGKRADPALLWEEKVFLTNPAETKRQLRDRLLPAIMLWNGGIRVADITAPKSTMWVGEGRTPVAIMRTSWTDPNAIYVAMKAGTPATSHAHMDIGSFVMEADGIRWATDFGMQQYESLESKGVDLWNGKQNSQRWQVFRYNNFVHNTLTVNDSLQRVTGKAVITNSSATPMFMNATTDLTSLYKPGLTTASRGIAIVDQDYVVVRDELEAPATDARVRWTMLTSATVKLVGPNRAELTQNGKILTLLVPEPAVVTMKTWPTTPPHDYDAPNPGTTLVGFEVTIPATTKAALTVWLLPQKTAQQPKPAVQPLAQWPH